MDINANSAHNQRKRRGRLVPMHIHGHHGVQTADRRRLGKRSEQVRSLGQIGHSQQIAAGQLQCHRHAKEQSGRFQDITIFSCNSFVFFYAFL
jgi:hypothetical protein